LWGFGLLQGYPAPEATANSQGELCIIFTDVYTVLILQCSDHANTVSMEATVVVGVPKVNSCLDAG
jgi:hypothetical protein